MRVGLVSRAWRRGAVSAIQDGFLARSADETWTRVQSWKLRVSPEKVAACSRSQPARVYHQGIISNHTVNHWPNWFNSTASIVTAPPDNPVSLVAFDAFCSHWQHMEFSFGVSWGQWVGSTVQGRSKLRGGWISLVCIGLHCLLILTAESIKIDKFRTIHLLILLLTSMFYRGC